MVHILLWNSYYGHQIFCLQFPDLVAPFMQIIQQSFDATTALWPDKMDTNLTAVCEISLREQFYVEQLAMLPLMAITQLHTYNEGTIHAITQGLDASSVNINGINTTPNRSLE